MMPSLRFITGWTGLALPATGQRSANLHKAIDMLKWQHSLLKKVLPIAVI